MATSLSKVYEAEFKNEPLIDFSDLVNRRAMERALSEIGRAQPRQYALRCGGREFDTDEKIASTSPSEPKRVLGMFQNGTVDIANQYVQEASRAFEEWKCFPVEERVACVHRAGEILRERRFELGALLCCEVGKSWTEADAEMAELIDFTEFYPRQMLRLAGRQKLTPVLGENNYLNYIPLGVGVVISPWNFPAAIMGGMTLACIVTGNSVIVKPSSQAPTIAAVFVEILHKARVPINVVSFFTGAGNTAGEALVVHPQTRFVAFTGSKRSGLRIHEQAARSQPGQQWIKRTILEMGGKDAIIVDDSADLDAAADGVAVSAFGYAGQKCSACSRAIVTEKVYDQFLKKLISRVKSISIGPPEDPSNFMGPVISQEAMRSILDYIDIGRKEGRLLTGGRSLDREGYFIEPTVIADVGAKARIAQEEIFGPVLAVIRSKNLDEALEIANDSEYGLTGAVYSRDPKALERAAEIFHVGNLYLNRKCTGAMVGAHPFGGFNMSGTDSKSGGEDYLLLFLQAKTVAEKIIR